MKEKLDIKTSSIPNPGEPGAGIRKEKKQKKKKNKEKTGQRGLWSKSC